MLKGTDSESSLLLGDNLTPAVCEPKARILTYLVPERDPTSARKFYVFRKVVR